MIDELRPGLSVNFSFGSPGSRETVELEGKEVICSAGESISTFNSVWMLQADVLSPGVPYSASLERGIVQVEAVG